MTTLQVVGGALVAIVGLFMLLRPGMFANGRTSRRLPPVVAVGVILAGAAGIVGAAQNQLALAVLSMLLALAGLVLIIVGLVKMRRDR